MNKLELFFNNLKVGTLSFDGDSYVFSYSTEFKNSNLDPVIEFSNKEIDYVSANLFSFFKARVPSKFRKKDLSAKEIIPLLQEHGKQVIHDPYILTPA